MSEDVKALLAALDEHYAPAIRRVIDEHERWCRENPEAAAFLASLPNGGWREGALAGKPER